MVLKELRPKKLQKREEKNHNQRKQQCRKEINTGNILIQYKHYMTSFSIKRKKKLITSKHTHTNTNTKQKHSHT
ncbi:hypothetical protein E2C01_007103 [Portunus trituberculatus]|uniref:Uncharacterized protein n=1 Tax=Portunus trituberculatus TaxID=210409 RepID=A0A5B7CWY2_PORTR|nr:hypothetical protein [Portunus trituberculatus]